MNGEKQGLATIWYEKGQKRYELNYVNGEVQGLATTWHENGQITKEECYMNDVEVDFSNCSRSEYKTVK